MKKFVLIFLTLLVLPVAASAFDNDKFCSELKEIQKTANADAGEMVDAYTRNDGMAVLCNSKMVDYKKSMKISFSDFKEGWEERKAQQWSQIYCEGYFLEAINNGWTISMTVTDKDGQRFSRKAECGEF